MPDSDIQDWYRGIPQISKNWFTGTVVVPLLGRIGLLNPGWMALEWTFLFQIWRPITSLFYFPITLQTWYKYLIMLYFLYDFSTLLETGVFAGRPADYLFMLIFNWAALVVIALFAGIHYLLEPMVLAVLYVWCQLNRNSIVQLRYLQFKAMYFPWIIFIVNVILRVW